jgi:hypothetical protein
LSLGRNIGEPFIWFGFFVLLSPDFVELYVQPPFQDPSPAKMQYLAKYYAD